MTLILRCYFLLSFSFERGLPHFQRTPVQKNPPRRIFKSLLSVKFIWKCAWKCAGTFHGPLCLIYYEIK